MARSTEQPPPIRSPLGRRKNGSGKLVLRLRAGMYRRDAGGQPLWRFLFRYRGRCRVIAARDWGEAHVEAAKVQATWDAEKPGSDPPGAGHTVNDLCDAFLASRGGPNSRTRPSTVEGYRRALERLVRPRLGHRLVMEVTPGDVTEWQRHNDRGKSRTRQKRIILLSMLFRHAMEQDWRPTSPVRKEHRVVVLRVGERQGKLRGDQRAAVALSPDQVDAIVDQLDRPDGLLVRLTAWTGLRVSEVIHLRTGDVNEGADILTVASDIPCRCRDCLANGGERQTKSGRARLVPVAPELVPDLRAYLAERSARFGPGGWLFPRWYRPTRSRRKAGDQRLRRDVLSLFQRAARSVGYTGLVFHDLRSTAHTWLTERSHGHLVAVSVALGHRLPGMAETYNRLATEPMMLAQALFPDDYPTCIRLATA